MSKINWMGTLGWSEEQLEDLRLAGYSYIRQGKYDIALPFFEALTVLSPDSSYDAQTLGALYLQLGEAEKALKSLHHALVLEAEHAPTLLNLTKALFMLGRHDEAKKLAEILSRESNLYISNMAKALLLAYGD
jgi:tetratricopeptide (TPR) repeat protein